MKGRIHVSQVRTEGMGLAEQTHGGQRFDASIVHQIASKSDFVVDTDTVSVHSFVCTPLHTLRLGRQNLAIFVVFLGGSKTRYLIR